MRLIKCLEIVGNILRSVNGSDLDITPVDVDGTEMYGIYFTCLCEKCDKKPQYLVISHSPDHALACLIQTTSNVDFLMGLRKVLDKHIAESN